MDGWMDGRHVGFSCLYSPHFLTGCLATLFDCGTLMLVLLPGSSLACAVTVVGKFALGTAVWVNLSAEAAVAHLHGHTAEGKYINFSTTIYY